ncbi:MAG: site-specific DNA-methyltransferase, partial [Chloroflexota bacterium]|nr:site-specific DNA-methyltransferase [Chloroflexota bacterium]
MWADIGGVSGKEQTEYPTQKPLALLERIIEASSNEGDMVLDPFAGVGTTGRVAGRLGRRFFMVEKSLDYFELQCMDIDIQRFFPDILDFEFFAGSS